jgi:PTH2 family peptidyl-tRNA hydrolase
MVKQVIVIRKDLGLSLGKYIAQAVHASNRADFKADYEQRVVCVVAYVKSEEKLLNLHKKCLEEGLSVGLQVDSVKNQVEAGTPTCLSIASESEEDIDKICKRLQLVKLDINWE